MGVQLENNSETKKYRKSIHELGELFIHRTFRPWFHYDFIYNLFGKGKEFQNVLQVIQNFTRKVVNSRRDNFLEEVPDNNHENDENM
jgi:hypothetical protein